MDPLVFESYLRPQIWGGRGLARLGKSLPADGPFGESWEISAHPHHVSRVAEGPLRGALLTDLWRERRVDLDGQATTTEAAFPWLVKYLDCQDVLSVQVHPSDETAAAMHARHEISDVCGKTEAWVVLHAEPSSRIYAGLRPGVGRADLEGHLDRGTVAECLHRLTPQAGDCLMLRAGTVHAVGGGVLIAEIQQTSDATFRLFDWNRMGADGQPRTLHRQQALAAIDWTAGPVAPVVAQLGDVVDGAQGEFLTSCPYFELRRYRVDGRCSLPSLSRMSIGMVLEGEAELAAAGGYKRRFVMGDTVLLPAEAAGVWRNLGRGAATLLIAARPVSSPRDS